MFLTFLFFDIIILLKFLCEVTKMANNTKLIAKNPNAYHNYEIIDKIECGIVLTRNRD